ncbi:hypothetical protein Y032_0610g621, partial [Ancylostoma ceylanicum]
VLILPHRCLLFSNPSCRWSTQPNIYRQFQTAS